MNTAPIISVDLRGHHYTCNHLFNPQADGGRGTEKRYRCVLCDKPSRTPQAFDFISFSILDESERHRFLPHSFTAYLQVL